MDRLVWENPSKEHELEFGNFNQFPPNWQEITEKEFVRKFLDYTPALSEYRQMFRTMDGEQYTVNGAKAYVSAKLYFMLDHTGYALSSKNDKLIFFRFGCDHRWQPATEEQLRAKKHWPLARTEYASFCPHCESFRVVDSSD